MCNTFTNLYHQSVTQHTTLSAPHVRKYPHWFSPSLISYINKKRRAWISAKRTGSQETMDTYRRIASSTKAAIRAATKKYECSLASNAKTNPKPLYAYLNRRRPLQPAVSTLTSNGFTTSDPTTMANILNDTYVAAFSTAEPLEIPPLPSRTSVTCPTPAVTHDEVLSLLQDLNPTKSPGADGIHPKVLKLCAESLAGPIFQICLASIAQGILPSHWQRVIIQPIYKKGCKRTPSNYRPIALNSIVCKLLEKIVARAITSHLLNNHLITNSQFGFLPGRNTVTNLISLLDHTTAAICQKCNAYAVFLDFAKAFDKVPHRLLLAKLQSYGIGGELLRWIESFLIGRVQRVSIAGNPSDWKSVLSGVIQGSVLGPLLFVVYMNDFLEGMSSLGFLYADDTTLLSVHPANQPVDEATLQTDLDKVAQWSRTWMMPLNVEKCSIMAFGHSPSPTRPYQIDGTPLMECTSTTLLGVLMTSDLRWTSHIQAVSSKALKLTRHLHKALPSPDPQTVKQLYTTLIRPITEYASAVCPPTTTANKILLESVQRRAIKWGTLRNRRYPDRLTALGLQPVEDRRKRGDCIQMFKHFSNSQPIHWTNPIVTPERSTRGHAKKYRAENATHHTPASRFDFLPNYE